ncbi:MAG: hypothetical protein FWC90_03510 [Oscillospiraceae bacterium]|nr:hypothetical protein [Oscillospiraceae bacterium]
MNLTVFSSRDGVFANCEYIKGYAFNDTVSGDICALLPVKCANFGLSHDSYAHFRRIECLSPLNCPA